MKKVAVSEAFALVIARDLEGHHGQFRVLLVVSEQNKQTKMAVTCLNVHFSLFHKFEIFDDSHCQPAPFISSTH